MGQQGEGTLPQPTLQGEEENLLRKALKSFEF
jgi:hypothetical protein